MSDQATVESIQDQLRDDLSTILYCDVAEIHDDVSFTELGLDSILGLELLATINGRYRLQEKIDVIYELATVTQLAAYLHSRTIPATDR